jgi:predicted DNA-binding transcriptional regulator YafY
MTYNASYPPELRQALIEMLARYVGKEKAIGRMGLVMRSYERGFRVSERQIRECIKYLRRNGYLICATPGKKGGYYMASTKAEFEEFDHAEFGAKIADMNETRQAMLKTVVRQFGEAVQLPLIGSAQ